MTTLQFLIVLILAAGVFGGGGYFIYDALHPYRFLHDEEIRKWVHPLAGEIKKARKLRDDGRLSEAQQLLRAHLRLHGKRPEAQAARDLLGEINTEMFFSTKVPFGKTEYVVERGDSLWRIARKLGSTPQTIQRANNLNSTRLRPGDRLWVPTAEFTITLDLPNERAVVHTGDGFFKQYPIVAVHLPRPIRSPITTNVAAVTFWKDGEKVTAPSEGERGGVTPWLHLAAGGYVLFGVSEEEGVSENAVEIAKPNGARDAPTPSRGFALHRDDLAELQLLIERGTPVTIVGASK